MNKLLKLKTISIVLTAVMLISLCSNTFSMVFANDGSSIIQLNNMSDVVDGAAVYKDQQGNIIGRIIGQSTEGGFTDNGNVGTMSSSNGSNKFEWQSLNTGTYRFKIEVSEEYSINVMVGQSTTTLTPVVGEENTYTFDVVVQAGPPIMINPGFTPINQNPQNSEEHNVTLDFQEAILTNNGALEYTVDGKSVIVKLVTKNNDTNQYQDVVITNRGNTPIDLGAHDYYLYVNRTNNNNVQIKINQTVYQIPGDSYFGLNSNDFQDGVLCILIESNNQGGTGEDNPPPFEVYDIIAKFEGNPDIEVISDFDGNIMMPEGWTEGNVEFYAKTCTVNGVLSPYHDNMECDESSYAELRLDIEGMINRDRIDNSVGVEGESSNENHNSSQVAVFTKNFVNYGRAGFHLCKFNTLINQPVNIITEDMIFAKAEAALGMTYSLGSATIDNVLLTNRQEGDVSIFFGNTETTIRVEGAKIKGITKVLGGQSHVINQDGTATVTLPSLSKETTTTLIVTIEMQNGATVDKTINVRRTAIELGFNTADGNATLEAGYVINRDYLYNGQPHNDEVFNAYLQVILYKDGVVAGYKQVQIDDEEFVNNDDNFHNGAGGAMELHSENRIKLYGEDLGDTIEGVNSASVFLTNGPIDFSSNTLPSVEFGIGSGVTIEFGGEE